MPIWSRYLYQSIQKFKFDLKTVNVISEKITYME